MFKLVVVILCFATLLVSTGSALTKDEYEISIKHGSFAVHQRHVNGLRKGEPPGPKVVEGPNRDSVQRKEQFYPGESATVEGEGEKISSTLAQPTRPSFGAKVSTSKPSPKSIDFEAVTPGLEEVPLQNSVFTSSQGYGQVRAQGPSTSYQSVEHYGDADVDDDDDSDERIAIVRPISAEDFYKTPQLRTPNTERGPVLFPNEPTTTNPTATTTSANSAGKLLKPIANSSAVQESEEIYLLLKYEAPRKKPAAGGASGDRQQSVPSAGPQVELESSNGELRLQDGRIRTGGGSFTTVGYFVSGEETSTVGPMPGTSTVASSEASPEVPRGRGKLRNSYGEHLNGDLSDFVNSIRPITENSQDSSGDRGSDERKREEIDANLDIAQMTRILAGRQGGLTIPEFNLLFRDYLKKDITVDDLEDFVKYNGEQEGTDESQDAPTAEPDATKSFDIRAENGKSVATSAGTPAKPSEQQPKVQVNKGPAGGKAGRKDKVVKIGYGGSKSYQGVYKSQKFLEKLKAERAPLLSEGAWSGVHFRQQLPVREIGPMAYVDNPVFGFAGARPRMGPMRGTMDLKPIHQAANGVHGGQSYVKFQKIS
ncbi:uncharacterized protein LOC128279115 [Anopheles cruzii]|uniref:uncharacterized protein LOC128279115 n=1 Tax=Anopheles cruzii TaxID=68878 RepID=UPI0022EC6294|nr:uncharacterized protein LOC128279115 [Anopheles cruzii]